MTREDAHRILGWMEQMRLDSLEAESKEAEVALLKSMRLLWETVRPYADGEIPFTEGDE